MKRKRTTIPVAELAGAIQSALSGQRQREVERGVIAFLAGYFHADEPVRAALESVLNAGDAAWLASQVTEA